MAGGAVSFFEYTDNTEVFSSGKWTKVEPLDMALTGLQGVTVDNNVYMIGEDRFSHSQSNLQSHLRVLSDESSDGKISHSSFFHALSTYS